MASRRRRKVLRESEEIARFRRVEFHKNQPHRRGLPDHEVLDELYGYPLGRLLKRREINQRQFRAGEDWVAVVLEYNSIMGLPDLAGRRPSGRSTNGEPDQAKIQKAREKYDQAIHALMSTVRGRWPLIVCKQVCIQQHEIIESQLADLRAGLDSLAGCFGILTGEAA